MWAVAPKEKKLGYMYELMKVAGLIWMGLDVVISMELRMKTRHARKDVQAVEFCVWGQVCLQM
jgi:hypothetical protein